MAPVIDKSFWRGKRVLLTGHTGFKGAWLCLVLERLGAEIHGLALPEESPSLFAQAGIRGLLSGEHLGDIADREAVARFVATCRPDIVIHFAAQALVRDCYRRPREAFATNVMGTVHVLDALRQPGLATRVVLTATTDKVYFNAEQGRPFREGDRLGGLEPYSASKAGAEMVVAAYRASYLTPLGIAAPVCRAGNVIGGGDWSAERLIPDIVRAVQSGAVLDVRSPSAVRPWQSVLDALAGYMLLAERAANGQLSDRDLKTDPEELAFNFGPSLDQPDVDVGGICRLVERLWPERFSWRATPDAERIAESKHLSLDPSRAERALGWRPLLSPEAAVRHTLDWYSAYLAGGDPAALCRRQIEEHLFRAS